MTTFPGTPQVQKGAIVGLDPTSPLSRVIVFQYNPEKLKRSLTAQAAGGTDDAAEGEALRIKGAPVETITIEELDIDAADQLERADGLTTSMGIYPTLASLEMLLYPKSSLVIANEVLSKLGMIEVMAAEAPLTLFIWGLKRVLPVRITSLTITEQAFDVNLNPIRATASISLRVLTYGDLGLFSAGGALFMVNQIVKEVMATIGGAGNVAGALSGSFSLGIGR